MDEDEPYDPMPTDGSYRGHAMWDWQKRAIQKWEDNHYSGVVEAITGTGKSLVGIAAIHGVTKVGGRALVVVPTSALLEQWWSGVRNALPGLRVGKLTAGFKDTFADHDVLIATVQTAYRALPKQPSLGLLVADESHRYGSSEYSKVLGTGYQRRLALSGTYERQQDDGIERYLEPYFGNVVHQYGYAAALHDQVVAPFHLGFAPVSFTPSEQKKFNDATERCEKSRVSLMRNYFYPFEWPLFFAQVQETLLSRSWGEEMDLASKYMAAFTERRTTMAEASAKEALATEIAPAFSDLSGVLVFTETKDSARRLAFGINLSSSAAPLTSDSKAEERTATMNQFTRGRLTTICAPRLLDEGIDVPEAELAVIIAASQTRRQMVQRMGRVIRLKKDRRHARILIVYAIGTPEDPTLGGHEGFLDQISDHAATITNFDESASGAIRGWILGEEIA
jgi:superfamily II DNA or RNA helicase